MLIVFTGIMAIATVAYVIGTFKLWQQTKANSDMTRRLLLLNYIALKDKLNAIDTVGATLQTELLDRLFPDLQKEIKAKSGIKE